MSSLPRLAVLEGKYAIGRSLRAADPYVKRYQAWELRTESQIIIEEYFPEPLAARDEAGEAVRVPEGGQALFQTGLQAFLHEAERLRGVDHPNVVAVRDVLQTNGTAYRVLDHHAGSSLAVVLERQGSTLPEHAAVAVLMPILQGLEAVHAQGLLHGGLTPAAVHLSKEGRPLLQHVRYAQIQLARAAKRLSDVVIPGYAAPEQYVEEIRQGPRADVYAGAAMLYRMISGETVPDVKQRLREDDVSERIQAMAHITEGLRTVLRAGLALDPKQRFGTVQALREHLEEAETAAAATQAPVQQRPEQATQEPSTAQWERAAEAAAPTSEPEEKPVVQEKTQQGAAELLFGPDPPQCPQAETQEVKAEEAEETHQAAPRATPKKRASWLVFVGVVLIAAVLGSTALLVQGDSPAAPGFSHAALFGAHADTLVAYGEYETAKRLYERALAANPGDVYLINQLAETKRRINQQKEQTFEDEVQQGDSLLALGDALVAAGREEPARELFAAANTHFLRALDLRPQDSLAMDRVQLAAGRLFPGDGAPAGTAQNDDAQGTDNTETIRSQMYTMLREQGDAHLEAGDTLSARRKFREALDIREDDYVQARLDEISETLSRQERDKRHRAAMQRGQTLYARGRYEEARVAFAEALEARPGNERAKKLLEVSEGKLQVARERAQQHQYYRAQGDVLAGQGDLEGALASYREALSYEVAEHVQERITELEQQVAKQAERDQRREEEK